MTFLDTINLRTTVVSTIILAVFAGSTLSPPVAAQDLGPTLILEDSIVLQESEDHYIGQPGEMILGPQGSFVVIDFFSANATRFDAAGRPIRTFGRRGQGPGEFYQSGIGGFVPTELSGSPMVNHRKCRSSFSTGIRASTWVRPGRTAS